MKDSFNSDFYITVATVIPVLYLALTLQGNTLDNLYKKLKNAEDEASNFSLKLTSEIATWFVAFWGGFFALTGITIEFFVILALYHRKATPAMSQDVFVGTTGLLIMVIAGPLAKFVTIVYKYSTNRLPEYNADDIDK